MPTGDQRFDLALVICLCTVLMLVLAVPYVLGFWRRKK